MSWFADDYKVPQKSSYMKMADGDNLVRFLAPPALGNELWMNGKPTRRKLGEVFTDAEQRSADINKFTGEPKKVQHFWACVVWNYKTNAIELLNITQADVQRDLLKLYKNPKWGSLDGYDINIIRSKEGQRTKYVVQPEPPTPMVQPIRMALSKTKIDMDKYFSGGHPIESTDGTPTSAQDDVDAILDEAARGEA